MNTLTMNFSKLLIYLAILQVFILFVMCSPLGRFLRMIARSTIFVIKLDYKLLRKTYHFVSRQIAKNKKHHSTRKKQTSPREKKVVGLNDNVIDINNYIKEGK